MPRRRYDHAKAAVLEKFNAPLQTRSLPLPDEVYPGAALVRTEMAGICGTDVHLWKGQLPIALPIILGHETVGFISELGEGLDCDWTGQPLEIGDRVTWNSATSCGQCFYCAEKRQPTRCPKRRAYGISYRCDEAPYLFGGYAEYHYLRPRTTIFKIPDDLPTESVIGTGCALITAIHGIERTGLAWRIRLSQGAGPVGIAALAWPTVGRRQSNCDRRTQITSEMARRFGGPSDRSRRYARAQPAPRSGPRTDGGYGADVVLDVWDPTPSPRHGDVPRWR
jgi:D-arabinose 1-dehydrogenase-like Zn-dependent alcohol dehydrogenase